MASNELYALLIVEVTILVAVIDVGYVAYGVGVVAVGGWMEAVDDVADYQVFFSLHLMV